MNKKITIEINVDGITVDGEPPIPADEIFQDDTEYSSFEMSAAIEDVHNLLREVEHYEEYGYSSQSYDAAVQMSASADYVLLLAKAKLDGRKVSE